MAKAIRPKKGNSTQSGTSQRMLTSKSAGQFNAEEWIKEGNHLFASAKATRATWVVKRQKLKRSLKTHGDWTHGTGMWADLEGLPKASILLLGYALEMYLKAGLAKAYQGCSEELFDRDVRRFSHEFKKIAKEIAFEITPQDTKDLSVLRDMVLFGARYPVKPDDDGTYLKQQAKRMHQVATRAEFTRMRQLVIRVKSHASRLDMDNQNPASFSRVAIDADGYVAFRSGGHLPSRVTVRYSTAQRKAGEDNLKSLHDLASKSDQPILMRLWNGGQAKFREDKHPEEGEGGSRNAK